MKHLVYILLGLMLVGVFSCRRSPGGTEARLVAIDSLITAEPDSALSLLADINADSLPADLRAYHDVLTTQALYKAYIPATTDTLIARAWSYYRDHGPYDRRIRAMLYSGTTAEELGHPDSAMRWYKRTELESRPDDHYHRAYALESMGMLYQNVYETRNSIDKYKLALSKFRKINDVTHTLFCETKLCQLYSEFNYDSTLYFGQNVKSLALQSNRDDYAFAVTKIIGIHLFYNKKFVAAKDSLLKIAEHPNYVTSEALYCLALSYANLNQIDSAQLFFSKVEPPKSVSDSILYFQFLSELCKHNNDVENSIRYEQLSNDVAADEMVASKENEFQKIEFTEKYAFYDREQNLLKVIISTFLLISIVGLIIYFLVSRGRRSKMKQELEDLHVFAEKLQVLNENITVRYKEALENAAKKEASLLYNQSNDITDSSLESKKFHEIISVMSESFRFIITQTRKNIKTEKELQKLDEAIRLTLTSSYFSQLRAFVDFAYSGLASSMTESGKLQDKDINVICMYLCRIPNTITRLYLGFSNPQNAIRYRNRIAEKYFGSKQAFESMRDKMQI